MSEQYEQFLERLRAAGHQRLANISAERERFASVEARIQVHPGVDVIEQVASEVTGEWVLPRRFNGVVPADGPVLLYLHGGAFMLGSAATCRPETSHLAAWGDVPVFSADYFHAPEHPFPAAVIDVVRAYRWLRQRGHEAAHLAVGGASAGASLALALMLHVRDVEPMPACAYLLSPAPDLSACALFEATANGNLDPLVSMQDAQEASRSYAGAECTLHPLMSTFNADLRGLPPILLHVGSIELFRDGVLRLAGRARRDGVEVTLEEWPEMCHAWAAFPGEFPEADDALRRAAEFIRQQLAE